MSQAYLIAKLTGEMQPADIPLGRSVSEQDLATLKEGDPDPLEVVVEIGPGRGGKGWLYTAPALQSLVEQVNDTGLAGILGHQRQEDLETQFINPVTHWVGARWQDGKAYIRGVVDKTAPDLKRWLKAGRINQPSIYTRPLTQINPAGETEVTALQALSIDWAPLGRAGMDSARVHALARGEMAFSELTEEELAAERTKPTRSNRGARGMSTLGEASNIIRNQRLSLGQVQGEVRWPTDDWLQALPAEAREKLVASISAQDVQTLQPAMRLVPASDLEALTVRAQRGDVLLQALELSADVSEPDALAAITNLRTAVAAGQQAEMQRSIAEAIGELHVPEALRPTVSAAAATRLKASTGDVKSIVGEILDSDAIKPLRQALAGWTPPPQQNGQSGGGATDALSRFNAGQTIGSEHISGEFVITPR